MRLPFPALARRSFADDHIAEVVAVSSTEYSAECLPPQDLQFPSVPPLGTWVKSASAGAEPYTVFGVVCFASTTPIDTVHRAIALGLSLEELRQQQPQVFAMFRSEIRVAMLGYQTAHQIYQHSPPNRRQFIRACFSAPVKKLSTSPIRCIFGARFYKLRVYPLMN
jgi:hypothetical protein